MGNQKMGRRASISDLTAGDKKLLCDLVLSYISDRVLSIHGNGHDWHHGNSELFLSRHRQYLAGLESFLVGTGNGRFTPLPKWDPGVEIPSEFSVAKASDTGRVRPPLQNLNPKMPVPTHLRAPNLCQISSGDALAVAIEGWHGQVHVAVGGAMESISIAPAAPIFWCWHAFIDDIY
ncbi:tyrosinase family protein [Streptomyces umbrinus]|uniref:tyrosinase family protein n=1 Tax=Streptomyces umbrinus TaxID=67370 RepID=UPI003439D4C2